jgi:hypothetical protein
MLLALATAGPAWALTAVPPGNRSVEQPAIPGASSRRTAALKSTFDAKYQKVLSLLQGDSDLRAKIRKAAGQFDIDPVHIAAAIVGEHTYNVDAYDRLQTYYVKAIAYVKGNVDFDYDGESIADFVARSQFEICNGRSESYALWSCRERVWNSRFRGKTVDGKGFPDDRFGAVFFQPFYAGQTFGIGQINPLTALQLSDIAAAKAGVPKLSATDGAGVYKAIMDPDLSLVYVAAAIRKSIDAYRSIAGFDISNNPGITATLYNTGNPDARASALRAENRKRVAAGEAPRLPEENYYGWLANDKIADLKALFP